jgi:transposase-like protein
MSRDVSDLCCVNSKCRDYGKHGAGNLMCRKVYGQPPRRFVRCRTCGQEFSERRGTAMFGLRMPQAKAVAIWEHVGDGCGVRQTARLVKVTTNTVMRLSRRAGEHARATHEELARDLKVDEIQLDEKWSFVGKKRGTMQSR